MSAKELKFEILGRIRKDGREDTPFTTVSTDVTEMYDSKVPLIATTVVHGVDPRSVALTNKNGFINKRNWSVSHYRHKFHEDRVGLRRFQMLRLDIFEQVWREPMSLKEYCFLRDPPGLYTYMGGPYECWGYLHHFLLEWDSKQGFPWLYKHDIIVYPFTDRDSMFVRPDDEFAYITDVLNNPGRSL